MREAAFDLVLPPAIVEEVLRLPGEPGLLLAVVAFLGLSTGGLSGDWTRREPQLM